jgi:hypothetical protein
MTRPQPVPGVHGRLPYQLYGFARNPDGTIFNAAPGTPAGSRVWLLVVRVGGAEGVVDVYGNESAALAALARAASRHAAADAPDRYCAAYSVEEREVKNR